MKKIQIMEIKEKIESFFSKNKEKLYSLPEKIELGYTELEFFRDVNSLTNGQIGYALNHDYTHLPSWDDWIIIGRDNQLGDPVFVDLSTRELPVYTSIHGQGEWKPEVIADSLAGFIASITILQKASKNRSNPKELELNPISDQHKQDILEEIRSVNRLDNCTYWNGLLGE